MVLVIGYGLYAGVLAPELLFRELVPGSGSSGETYAKDPGVLLSVDDAANQIKGDKEPEGWLPPNTDYRCEYAWHWVWIKHTWNLTVNAQERTTLQEMLQGCESQ